MRIPALLASLSALLLLPAGCALFQDDLSNVETYGAREVEGSLGEFLAIRFDPGDEVVRMDDEHGGIRTEVIGVENRLAHYSVAVTLLLHNRYDERLQFSLDDVRIDYQGDEYSARPGHDWTASRDVAVDPKSYQKVVWEFELGTFAKHGVYDVTIRDMERVMGSERTPVGRPFTFQVKVPGERRPAKDDAGEGA